MILTLKTARYLGKDATALCVLVSSFQNAFGFENRTIIKEDTAEFVRQGQVKMLDVTTHVG